MFGIICEEPTFLCGNNQSVLATTSVPASNMRNNSNSIVLYFIQEAYTIVEWKTTYVNTHKNPVDLLKKLLPLGDKSWIFIWIFLYWL